MDLKVQCKQREQLWGKTTVRIGTSSEQEKCVAEPVKHLRCDDVSGNPQYRSSGTDKPDSFYVEQRHGKVCARIIPTAAGNSAVGAGTAAAMQDGAWTCKLSARCWLDPGLEASGLETRGCMDWQDFVEDIRRFASGKDV